MNRLSDDALRRVVGALDAHLRVSDGYLCDASCSRALGAYGWELQIASAVSETLKHVERSLRTTMNRELVALAGRADWWSVSHIRLHSWALEDIGRARSQLVKLGRTATPQDVTGRLMFGFWTSLLGSASGADYETQLWRPALHKAFPGYRGERRKVYQRVEFLRRLRNQADHPDDEPIGDRDLVEAVRTVALVLGWIDPAVADWVEATSRVPAVLAARPAKCTGCSPLPRQRTGASQQDGTVRP
jgi:hypothetical protein